MLDVIFRLGKDRYKSSTFNASQRTFNDFSTEFNSPTILLTSTKWSDLHRPDHRLNRTGINSLLLLNYQNHSYLAKVVKKSGIPLTGAPIFLPPAVKKLGCPIRTPTNYNSTLIFSPNGAHTFSRISTDKLYRPCSIFVMF